MVSTRSPGSAIASITAATRAVSGTNLARPPGTASTMSWPVTPGQGLPGGTVGLIASSASASAAELGRKILVRLNRCG